MILSCRSCNRFHNLSIQGTIPYLLCQCGEKIIPGNEQEETILDTGNPVDEKCATFVMKKELSALIEISRLLVSTFDKDTLLNDIFNVTRDTMNVEAVSILLYDGEQDDMAFYMSRGPGAEEIGKIRLAKGEGLAGWVFLNKKSVVVNDTSQDERFSRRVDDDLRYTSRNLIAVPVFVGSEIIGVMEVVNKKGGETFSGLDLKLFESIANHVGEVLEKARLMEENIKNMRLATIGQTIANLSHCIKNILNGLSGGAYIVNKALESKNLEMLQNGWEIVDKCIARITDLSMNMLAYSKERKPLYKKTNPNTIVKEVTEMLARKIQENSITLTIEPDPGIKEIPLDSYGIFRCMLNLITNAIEACPAEHGKVTIRTMANNNGNVVIEIIDNGPGIEPDKKEKVFSVFFSTKGGQGTGLGLAVSKKIMDEHRGKIWLESSPGSGTHFFVELPARVGKENYTQEHN